MSFFGGSGSKPSCYGTRARTNRKLHIFSSAEDVDQTISDPAPTIWGAEKTVSFLIPENSNLRLSHVRMASWSHLWSCNPPSPFSHPLTTPCFPYTEITPFEKRGVFVEYPRFSAIRRFFLLFWYIKIAKSWNMEVFSFFFLERLAA